MMPLHRHRDLTVADAAAAFYLAVHALLVRLLLSCVALPTLSRAMAGRVSAACLNAPLRLLRTRTDRLPRLCALASRPGPAAGRCLVSALLLYGSLKARGEDAALCVGVRSSGPAFPAHAWVERDGMPFGAGDVSAFAVLARL